MWESKTKTRYGQSSDFIRKWRGGQYFDDPNNRPGPRHKVSNTSFSKSKAVIMQGARVDQLPCHMGRVRKPGAQISA